MASCLWKEGPSPSPSVLWVARRARWEAWTRINTQTRINPKVIVLILLDNGSPLSWKHWMWSDYLNCHRQHVTEQLSSANYCCICCSQILLTHTAWANLAKQAIRGQNTFLSASEQLSPFYSAFHFRKSQSALFPHKTVFCPYSIQALAAVTYCLLFVVYPCSWAESEMILRD